MIIPAQACTQRLRRLRRTPAIRALRRETRLHPHNFVQPVFVVERDADAGHVASLPGVRRHTLAELPDYVDQIAESGVRGVLVFGVSRHKDALGSSAWSQDGVVPRAIDRIKSSTPELAVLSDVCLCQYTSHGHCGVLGDDTVLNDSTLELLARVAISHAAAGADLVAPSGMMDGAVAAVRRELDRANYHDVGILSYAVKYASSFYGPFRDAVQSGVRHADRRTHQMDPANAREALAEAARDVVEGADMLMVKPAGAYLDIIASLRESHPQMPLAGYQVSGEYAMIVAAARNGWLDEQDAMLESLLAIKRAGADVVITYAATAAASWLTLNMGDRP